jgi:hypothetical protein
MELRNPAPFEYPPFNKQIFEEFYYDYYTSNQIETEREYLSIFWTAYYLRKDYGKGDLSDLQAYLDQLDRNKKYFTLIQYDDGILNDISGLDLYVFSLAQDKKYDFILPTTCLPRPNINKNRTRDIFCSFFGRYKGEIEHPLREELINTLAGKDYNLGNYIDYQTYCNYLERSKFFLCVNGRSPTTFKICECFQTGTIPVFIYDKKWIPFGSDPDFKFDKACVMIPETQMDKIDEILKSFTEKDIKEMLECGEYIYKNYYEYNNLAKKVTEIAKKI